MTKNAGQLDRTLRIVAGLALLACVALVEGNLRWLGLIGVVPLLTGIVGNCPLYALLGVSTCGIPRS